ncbi:hypothetical protein MKW92_045237 [Papaver armeniacum]|nr:hypothetical protein MKW92_045237 [Papaver armeniacum]
MGLFNSTIGDSERGVSRWRLTGIAALRDCKLKIFPNQAFEVEASARTLDLTNNKIADNHIECVPVNLGKLQSLKMLTLDGNRKLEQLSVSRNLLTSLWKDSKILKEKRKVRQAY